jgi:cell division protein FtsL
MNTARVRTVESIATQQVGYVENPIETQVIEGYFQKEISQKAMAIRKVNKTLCALLGVAVLFAIVSYYFAMSNELALNKLSRQITTLNDENAELQNNLDRLKSFNNVDNKMGQYNMLTKAEKVIEVQAVESALPIVSTPQRTASFDWAIGY